MTFREPPSLSFCPTLVQLPPLSPHARGEVETANCCSSMPLRPILASESLPTQFLLGNVRALFSQSVNPLSESFATSCKFQAPHMGGWGV